MPRRIYSQIKLTLIMIVMVMVSPSYAVVVAQSIPSIRTIVWDPQGRYIASGGLSGIVEIRDSTGPNQIVSWSTGSPIYALAFEPNLENIAISHYEKIEIYSLQGTLQSSFAQNNDNPAQAIGWSPNGVNLFSGIVGNGDKRTVAKWDVRSGNLLKAVESGSISSIAYGSQVGLWAAGGSGIINLWNSELNFVTSTPRIDDIFPQLIWKLRWSPSTTMLAAGHQNGLISLWSYSVFSESLTFSRSLQGTRNTSGYYDESAILDIKFSADGQRLLSLGADGTLRLWNVALGTLLSDESLDAPISAGEFNPVNDMLALAKPEAGVQMISVSNKLETATPSPMPTNTPSLRP